MLIERLMSLKHVIFDELVRRHKDRIYGYALYLLRNRQDAEDITQEALLRLWTHRDRVRLHRVGGWIMRVTRNLCLDHLRRASTAGRRGVTVDTETVESLADEHQPGPSRVTDGRLLREQVEQALHRLPETQRSAFVLREVQGFKYREIADALDVPMNTVKVYLLRARLALRKELNEYAPTG